MKLKYLIICILMSGSLATASSAASVTHNFDVQIGIFDAAKCKFRYEFDSDNYKTNAIISTSGFFDKLYPFTSDYSSQGIFEGEKIIATKYLLQTKSRNNTRSKRFIYDNKGNIISRISTKNGHEKAIPVEPQNGNYLSDIQSVLIHLLYQLKQTDSCQANYHIFNSKKYFSVYLKDKGTEEISTPYFSGKTIKCAMYIDSEGNKEGDVLFDNTSDNDIFIWFAKNDKNNMPYAVKAEISNSPLGTITITATNINFEE